MLEILFEKIPSTLFEPFAICALLGALLTWPGRTSKRKYFWIAGALTIGGMLLWRTGILIQSSRYASLLIIPAIVLTAYCCILVKPRLLKFEWIARIRGIHLLPWLLAGGILLISIGKDFRFDADAKRYPDFGQAIRKNLRPGEKAYLMADSNYLRYAYYAGISPQNCIRINDEDPPQKLLPKIQRLFNSSTAATVIYLLQTREEANLIQPPASRELLLERRSGRHDQKITRLFACRPWRIQDGEDIFSPENVWETSSFQAVSYNDGQSAVKLSGRTRQQEKTNYFTGRIILPQPLDLRGKTVQLKVRVPECTANIECFYLRFYNRDDLRKPAWNFLQWGAPFAKEAEKTLRLRTGHGDGIPWEAKFVSGAAPGQITEIGFGIGSRIPDVALELYCSDFIITETESEQIPE